MKTNATSQVDRLIEYHNALIASKMLSNVLMIRVSMPLIEFSSLAIESGERVLKPMRYHLRPPGMNAEFDRKYPGCYNASRDSLAGFWKNEFGSKHGVIVVTSFFENVALHDLERRIPKTDESEKAVVI